MKFLLLILVPLAAQAQLVLFTVDGGTETPVGAAYSLGAIASGATSTAHFRVRNTGITPVVVTPVLNNGQPGTFSLSSVGGANPCSGPNGLVCIDFSVAFLAPSQTLTNNYSAPLQVAAAATSSINVLLTASAVPGPTLTGFPPGCLQSGPTSVAFAAVNIGSLGQCNFSLQNTNSVAIPVSTIQVSGAAFQISPVVTTPLTLAPNNAVTFTIQFQPVCGTVSYAGVLTINSTVYQISGTALTPNLPTPALNFDAANFSSMEQHTLTMTLPVTGGVRSDRQRQPGIRSIWKCPRRLHHRLRNPILPLARIHGERRKHEGRHRRPSLGGFRDRIDSRRPIFLGERHAACSSGAAAGGIFPHRSRTDRHRQRDGFEPTARGAGRDRHRLRQHLFHRENVVHIFQCGWPNHRGFYFGRLHLEFSRFFPGPANGQHIFDAGVLSGDRGADAGGDRRGHVDQLCRPDPNGKFDVPVM